MGCFQQSHRMVVVGCVVLVIAVGLFVTEVEGIASKRSRRVKEAVEDQPFVSHRQQHQAAAPVTDVEREGVVESTMVGAQGVVGTEEGNYDESRHGVAKQDIDVVDKVKADGAGGSKQGEASQAVDGPIEGLFNQDTEIIACLDQNNFDVMVLGSEVTWVILFYASWCGHCQNYAPSWRALAHRLSGWRHTAHVGAINCGDPFNSKICNAYQIEAYPTLKVVPQHSEAQQAINIKEFELTVSEAERRIAAQIAPQLLPALADTREEVQRFLAVQPSGALSIVVAEETPRIVFQTVWLHFSNILASLHVLGFSPSQQNNHPTLQLYRGSQQVSSVNCLPDNDCVADLAKLLVSHLPESSALDWLLLKYKPGIVLKTQAMAAYRAQEYKHPHYNDLVRAINHALRFEVRGFPDFNEQQLETLKEFVRTISRLDLGSRVRAATKRLSQSLSVFATTMPNEEWSKITAKMTLDPNIKSMPWVQCAGSRPQYRGYTCGLWTLFHTMVEWATTNVSEEYAIRTLGTIAAYVDTFFGCRDCAAHFGKMARNMKTDFAEEEALSARVWLWRAHNKANKRIGEDKSDISTDPLYPKIQFPSVNACNACHSQDSRSPWHMDKVDLYLKGFYGTVLGCPNKTAPEVEPVHVGRQVVLPPVQVRNDMVDARAPHQKQPIQQQVQSLPQQQQEQPQQQLQQHQEQARTIREEVAPRKVDRNVLKEALRRAKQPRSPEESNEQGKQVGVKPVFNEVEARALKRHRASVELDEQDLELDSNADLGTFVIILLFISIIIIASQRGVLRGNAQHHPKQHKNL
eukprot:m.20901 g.20901  ORF g.20901 m.20901 type:complete len:805 (-) comp8229_c0_seq1:970-3384(-)